MKDLPDIVGVSAPTVKNTCRKFDIPVPVQGHWAKIKAGRKVRIVPLSNRAPGMYDELILGGSGYYRQFVVLQGNRSRSSSPAIATRTNKVHASWPDTQDSKLEARLPEIAVELVVLMETLHRQNAERKKAAADAARLEAICVRQEAFRDRETGNAAEARRGRAGSERWRDRRRYAKLDPVTDNSSWFLTKGF